MEKVNVNGGAIALAIPSVHPARAVVSAVHELIRCGTGQAAAWHCAGGGGQGEALLLSR